MSRNNEFFHACEVDNWYIFEHTEYEWDDIVNAFIAGGLYADKNPRIQWVKLTDESVKELFDYARYLVYRADYDEYYILDETTIKGTINEGKYTHAKLIEGPGMV